MSKINIFSCYFRGGAAGSTNLLKSQFKSDLLRLSRTSGNYLLGGDFNCRNQAWGCLRANCWGNILENLLMTNEFAIAHTPNPTFVPNTTNSSPSVLDFFLTNAPDKLSGPMTMNSLGSDHLPVLTFFNSSFCKTVQYKFNLKRTNWGLYKRTITNLLHHHASALRTSSDIDNAIRTLIHSKNRITTCVLYTIATVLLLHLVNFILISASEMSGFVSNIANIAIFF